MDKNLAPEAHQNLHPTVMVEQIFAKYCDANNILWLYANGSKPDAVNMLKTLLGLHWQTVNAEEVMDRQEPSNALEAIEFKLGVGRDEQFLSQLEKELGDSFQTTILAVLASDVVYINPQGLEQLKLERKLGRNGLDNQVRDIEINQIVKSFEKQADEGAIFVSWIITFGLQLIFLGGLENFKDFENLEDTSGAVDDKVSKEPNPVSPPSKLTLKITAQISQPPTKNDIDQYFDPSLSPGFKLIEFLKETNQLNNIVLEFSSSQENPQLEESLREANLADIPALAVMLIAHKVLPDWMFAQLLPTGWVTYPNKRS
jgi:hypothetical protein